MLISFVIPVYNVEKYILKCIESIIHQNYHNYEIILVDDGSKDNSGKMCDELAKKYNCIFVFHQKNGGLSAARNTGIKHASGDYILFVDSDDYIGEGSLLQIVKCLERQNCIIDVMFLDIYKFFPDNTIEFMNDGYVEDRINGKNKGEVMKFLVSMSKYPGSACSKLVRRDLLITNKLYFEENLLSEDLEWTIRLLMASEYFAYCSAKYYFYRQNRIGSITNTVNDKTIKDLIYIIEKWASKDMNRLYQREINAFISYVYMILIYNLNFICVDRKYEYIKRIQSKVWVMKYAKSKNTKIVAFLINIWGINKIVFVLKCLYDLKKSVLRL